MNSIPCLICNQNIELVKNSDIPICNLCLQQQAQGLKSYHELLKEEIQKNPNKKIYQPEINEIIPEKLYLGNFEAAECLEILKQHKITHILVCGEFLDINFPEEFKYHQLPIQDSLTQSLFEYLEESIKFIEQGECVFVHCAAGIHRSPAIVCAYLMHKNKWTYDQTFEFLLQKRPKVHKQTNFTNQLKKFEETILVNSS